MTWQPPTCTPPTAGDLIRRYMDLTDFTYPINTASKTAQRLFDLVCCFLKLSNVCRIASPANCQENVFDLFVQGS